MQRGYSLGFATTLVCALVGTPWAMANELASPSSVGAKASPPQQIVTDRNGVILDIGTTPALAYLRPSKNPGEQPLQLSLEIKSSKILDEELASGLQHFSAKAAAGFIMDVNTGEIIALSSVGSASASAGAPVNHVTQGAYEIGSSAKLMTVAMALDTGKASMTSRIDGSVLHHGKFAIHDSGPQRRMLTLSEVVKYSSNIGVARLAQRVGTSGQKAFLEKMGQLDSLDVEGVDKVAPVYSKDWPGIYTLTVAFGQGIAVSPLQSGMAVGALVNGGMLVKPTILKVGGEAVDIAAPRVISPDTSMKMRYLMRLNVEEGTARKADVAGYLVGGATSTSEKVVDERYAPDRVITTFTAIYPADKPKYLVMTILDEPQALPETFGFRTAAWNAAVVAAKVIERTAPVLGVERRAIPGH